MPGLVITTGVRVGATGTTNAPASSFFIAGTAERGPVDDYRLVESMAQAEALYGDYVNDGTLFQHLQTFFEEGGTRAYVMRVVGGDAVTAGASLNGGKGIDISDGDDALYALPVGPGAWANTADNLKIDIVSGVTSNTVRYKLWYKNELVYFSGDLASNKAVADSMNANVGNFIVASYDATQADNVTATGTNYSFTGGVDDNEGDGGVGFDADLVGALDAFVPELGAGVVAIPEFNGTVIWDGLRQHALDNSRIAYCAFPVDGGTGKSYAAVDGMGGPISILEDGDGEDRPYYGALDAEKTAASVMAFFWPQVLIPFGAGTLSVSPESFAAAARCRAHLATGPWRPSAGVISASRFAVGLDVPVNSVASDTANAARINPLRIIDGGVRLYGARSVSADEDNWRYITFRDTLNYIVVAAEKRLEPFIFNTIDSRKAVFSEIAAALVNVLDPIRAAGGLFEGPNDRGYVVEVSSALNPQAQLAQGIIAAKVGVRVSSVGETINLLITKSNLTSAV